MYFARRLTAILTLILAGCQYDPFTSIYTRRQPKVEDLIGVYVPDDDTKKEIREEGHYPDADIFITLGPNRQLTTSNLPDWWQNEGGRSRGGFDSGSGTWDVEKHQEYWVVGVMFTSVSHSSPYPHQLERFATDIFLTGEKPPYKIHIVLGDPDEGRGMDFVRAPNKTR